MLTNIMAKSPRAFVFSFFSSIPRMIYSTPRPVHFQWNFYKYKVDIVNFVWNNSISTKLQKRRNKITQYPYINLFKKGGEIHSLR